MIRKYTEADFEALRRMHQGSGLPENCFPDLHNPNYVVKIIAEKNGLPVQAGFVKLTGEAYVLVDHEHGTPQERMEILSELVAHGLNQASRRGLQDVSAWLPPQLEESFGKRLESLGWVKSPWRSWTALLNEGI